MAPKAPHMTSPVGSKGPGPAAPSTEAAHRSLPRGAGPRGGSRGRFGAIALACLIGAICLILMAPTHMHIAASGATAAFSDGGNGLVSVTYNGPIADSGVAPLPAGEPVWLTVTMMPSHYAALNAFDAAVIDPQSPLYHHFLTESQFQSEYAPAPQTTAQVQSYFDAYGASSWTITPDGFGATFEIPGGQATAALHSELLPSVAPSTMSVLAFQSNPTLPAPVASDLLGVGEAVAVPAGPDHGVAAIAPAAARAPTTDVRPLNYENQNGTEVFTGADYAQLYGDTDLFPGGTFKTTAFASNMAVATILWSGQNSTGQGLQAPFDPAVVAQYFNMTFPTNWPQPTIGGDPVPFAGITPPDPGPLATTDPSGVEGEAYLDLEMAGSMAPGATVETFYGPGFDVLISDPDMESTALSQALSFTYGGRTLAAVSGSFGLVESNDSLWNAELLHAGATGVTVFASTGDTGSAPIGQTCHVNSASYNPEWPSNVAFANYGTVAVGGTTVTASGKAAQSFAYDSGTGTVSNQMVWYQPCQGQPGEFTGSTGGISEVIPEPAFQSQSAAQTNIVASAAIEAKARGISGSGTPPLGRGVPDISLSGNNTAVYFQDGTSGQDGMGQFGGTSVASPMLAGMFTEMAAVEGHGFGYILPAVYDIASYYIANPGSGNPFLPVTQGSNFLFQSGPGWNAATGWGGMQAGLFILAFNNPSIANFGYGSSSSGLSLGTIEILAVIIVIIAVVAVVIVAFVVMPRRRAAAAPMASTPPPPPMAPSAGYPAAPMPWAPAAGPPPPSAAPPGPPAYVAPPLPPQSPAPVAPPQPAAPSYATPAAAPSAPGGIMCPRCGRPRPWGPMPCPSCGNP